MVVSLKLRPQLHVIRHVARARRGDQFADEEEGRVFIKALRNIQSGEELNYDYGLIIDAPYTKKLLAEYPCWCGSKNCRGTLLSPNDDKPTKKAKAKAKAKAKSKAKDKKKKKAKNKA